MSKAKRLMELMMAVNRKKKFTVKELAREFDVSTRTILRDLQELSELGVPLYSEVGPHGGYQVLKERILPPIAFTEEEAVAIFFACHALRHYSFLPFETESSSALSKFYYYMSGDVRDRIDQMKNRVDFVTPRRQAQFPYLSILLDGAIYQKIILIDYESREGKSSRQIQPIGLYASSGLWYCPAYCFQREDYRVFRCDRIHSATYDPSTSKPRDLRHIHLGNRESVIKLEQEHVSLYVELSQEGVQKCEAELWSVPSLHIRNNGTGWLEGNIPSSDLPFFAKFFIGLGNEATVKHPQELVEGMKRILAEIMAKYE
ncbi:DeoR family transcriptional regulator [Paenibacillus baekrokdamisoli]|uniref:DeoR family transcriptional regulator n=1 Tax=Paenibacillus baekrokdamisoli TaxID=1712516 RepID=A0A3G9J1E3_9BACL|nr:YafY family protein [Paenibacillus baekrokdamisoli]MBB3071389.1 putative DNA-binding transcriptional regulator YafY [Paenibacillus baekrokdamisoli]BBH24576.1 DeoR family transcriptional regulator [Paenibacillus baekrokdamisoli]